jgi:hypothetical protein
VAEQERKNTGIPETENPLPTFMLRINTIPEPISKLFKRPARTAYQQGADSIISAARLCSH